MPDIAIDAILYSIVQQIFKNENYEFVSIAFEDTTAARKIKWIYALGNQNLRYQRIALRSGIGIAGIVIRTGMPFIANDLSRNHYADAISYPITLTEQLTNAVAIPIFDVELGRVGGVLLAGNRHHAIMNEIDVENLKKYLGNFAQKV